MDISVDFEKICYVIQHFMSHSYKPFEWENFAEYLFMNPEDLQKLIFRWAGVAPDIFFNHISSPKTKEHLAQSDTWNLKNTKNLKIYVENTPPKASHIYNISPTIYHSFTSTLFGHAVLASTYYGLCYLAFAKDAHEALNLLEKRFSFANLVRKRDNFQKQALLYLNLHSVAMPPLHLYGTDFQINVWKELLKIPTGKLYTYGTIAKHIKFPKAFRAVGTAVGNNPISFIIPCHRVIPSDGSFGNYRWGNLRKVAMIIRELCSTADQIT